MDCDPLQKELQVTESSFFLLISIGKKFFQFFKTYKKPIKNHGWKIPQSFITFLEISDIHLNLDNSKLNELEKSLTHRGFFKIVKACKFFFRRHFDYYNTILYQ